MGPPWEENSRLQVKGPSVFGLRPKGFCINICCGGFHMGALTESDGAETDLEKKGVLQLSLLRERRRRLIKSRAKELWKKVRHALLTVGNLSSVQETLLWNANVKDVIDALKKGSKERTQGDIIALSKVLSTIKALSHLSLNALEEVARAVESETVPQGNIIFNKGDDGDKFYVILSGRVGVLGKDEEDQDVVLVRLHTGDCFGELALINGSPRCASCKALDNALLLTLDRTDFLLKVQLSQERETKRKMADLARCSVLAAGVKRTELFRILASVSVLKAIRDQEVIYRQGEDVDAAYIVRKGYVRLVRAVSYTSRTNKKEEDAISKSSVINPTSAKSRSDRASITCSAKGMGRRGRRNFSDAKLRNERYGTETREALLIESQEATLPLLPISAVRELRLATVMCTEKRTNFILDEQRKLHRVKGKHGQKHSHRIPSSQDQSETRLARNLLQENSLCSQDGEGREEAAGGSLDEEPRRRLCEIFERKLEHSPLSARLYRELERRYVEKSDSTVESCVSARSRFPAIPSARSSENMPDSTVFDKEVRAIASRGGPGAAGRKGVHRLPSMEIKPEMNLMTNCTGLNSRFSATLSGTPEPHSLLTPQSRAKVNRDLLALEKRDVHFEVDHCGPGAVIGLGEVLARVSTRATHAIASGRAELVRISKWDLIRNFTRKEISNLLTLLGPWEKALRDGELDEELAELAGTGWEWKEIRQHVLQTALKEKGATSHKGTVVMPR